MNPSVRAIDLFVLLTGALVLMPGASQADVSVNVNLGPPPPIVLVAPRLRWRPPVRRRCSTRNRMGATSRPQVQQARVGLGRPAASSQMGEVTRAVR